MKHQITLAAMLVLALAFVVGCGMSRESMTGSGSEKNDASVQKSITAINTKAVTHRAEAMKLVSVKEAIDLESAHHDEMKGDLNEVDEMMSCHQDGAENDSMGQMMDGMMQMGSEVDRHEQAIKNCTDLEQVQNEEDQHLSNVNGMMEMMQSHMSATGEGSSCEMMGSGGLMGN
jgi:5,10-methenyltetrahydromethanopterin hydrogenase